jgi:hypothetical protein
MLWLLTVWKRHARRPGTAHAEARRFESELTRAMRGLVFDFIDANRIFEHRSVRSEAALNSLKIEAALSVLINPSAAFEMLNCD